MYIAERHADGAPLTAHTKSCYKKTQATQQELELIPYLEVCLQKRQKKTLGTKFKHFKNSTT